MNKSAIQKYAIWARTEMISQVEQRAYQYGITKDGYGEENAVTVMGRALTPVEQEQRWELIQQIKHKGFAQVMEEVAYTWFNRFIALRFMEVNNYLPTHTRVFSDSTSAFKPEILSSAMQVDLDGLDRAKIAQMIDANQTEDLYRYLLLTQCNALNEALPRMFEKMGGYTELLLPNNILRADSILGRMVNEIPESDWNINALDEEGNPQGQVQIIGWLYQFYNTELNEQVYDGNMSKNRIEKELLPAATTIYTPDWAVQYMVQNSLGKLWLEGHDNAELKNEWKYYLEEVEQEPDVEAQLDSIRTRTRTLNPCDIKVIDPCMGSGHILVYAFDVLVQIYRSYGISERDAARSILENNLYGLDIDDRAAQLAYFAIMMKARQYDRRIFTRGVQPNVYAIQESNTVNQRHLKFMGWQMSDLERSMAMNQLAILLEELRDAKEYGSILNITKQDWDLLYRFVLSVDYSGQMSLEAMGLDETKDKLFELVQIAATMAQKYDVVVTNPPYLGYSRFSPKLDKYVKDNYADVKTDLSTVMYKKSFTSFSKRNGYTAFITTSSWMFLSSFEKLRTLINSTVAITSLVDFGTELFEGKVGHNSIVAWVTRSMRADYKMRAVRLVEYCYSRRDEKEPQFFNERNRYTAKQTNFSRIPGAPIAYWVSDRFIENFAGQQIRDSHYSGGRNKTHNNEKYTRMWWEIADRVRWQLYAKGGDYRRWYGNHEVVVDWSEPAKREYDSHGGLYNQEYSGKTGISWTLITSGKTAFRVKVPYAHYDSGAPTIFNEDFTLDEVVLGFLNSNVATEYLSLMNPTINMGNTYVLALPNMDVGDKKNEIRTLVKRNIELCKVEWDSYELSMEFLCHPLAQCRHLSLISECAKEWAATTHNWFEELRKNEEKLNEIYVDVYGLSGEISSKIPEKDVSIRLSNQSVDICNLISYAVGCMFGRYSLDVPGLAYAGGTWDPSKYKMFLPEVDNIIPICDDDYFDDDIVARFVKWVETVYGKDTLEENLKFIANALGGKGTPREVIRNYFLNDFYTDHLKIYQKRPIYWLFDSGKKNGFKALIYMHRYQSDLLARMRTDYVHEMQERYRTQLAHLSEAIPQASTSERVKLNKQLKKIQDQALELQKYEEKIHHLADRNISIDLDDGVKHNYALFGDVLAKIK